jgi:hypothetical protein
MRRGECETKGMNMVDKCCLEAGNFLEIGAFGARPKYKFGNLVNAMKNQEYFSCNLKNV